MKLIDFDEKSPPQDELVLVIQELTGICLREFHGESCYDENNNLDDSDLEFYWWASLEEIREQM